ncbi:MAG: trypsin-like peptidase domain-containing protein [Gemmatimonadaceae bacterium]
MILELRVLSGARSGQHDRFEKSVVTLGRHPLCDVRFDPTEDLDVSARHAELRTSGDRVTLRDTGSTNGTFVNGQRISRERELVSGDVVSLGEFGPKVKIDVDLKPTDLASTVQRPVPAATLAGIDASPTRPRQSRGTTQRLIAVMTERVSRLQTLLGISLVAVLVVVIAAFWLSGRGARAREAELAVYTRRIDSLQTLYSTNVSKLNGQVVGLDSSFAGAQQELLRLRGELARGGDDGSGRTAARLRSDAERVTARSRALLNVDYNSIFERNTPAVVLLAIEWPDGKAFTGSGFNTAPGGTIVTSRHLLVNEAGEKPKKIIVLFNKTKAWLPAHTLRVSDNPDEDIGVLKIDAPGPFPVIDGIESTPAAVGAPIAIIGYPLGIELPMEGSAARVTASSTLGAGTISKELPHLVQIDAYAAEGSSGSPVFDAKGRVIGVVYGGARESAGRIVFAVPAAAVTALLRAP